MKAWFTFSDGRREPAVPHEEGGTVRIPKEELSGEIRQVEFELEEFSAPVGSDGGFVVPNIQQREGDNLGPGGVIRFRQRPEGETLFPFNSMPFFAVLRGKGGTLIVVSGMSLEYELAVTLRDGVYRMTPRFRWEGTHLLRRCTRLPPVSARTRRLPATAGTRPPLPGGGGSGARPDGQAPAGVETGSFSRA